MEIEWYGIVHSLYTFFQEEKTKNSFACFHLVACCTFSVFLSKMQFRGKSMGVLWAVFDF